MGYRRALVAVFAKIFRFYPLASLVQWQQLPGCSVSPSAKVSKIGQSGR